MDSYRGGGSARRRQQPRGTEALPLRVGPGDRRPREVRSPGGRAPQRIPGSRGFQHQRSGEQRSPGGRGLQHQRAGEQRSPRGRGSQRPREERSPGGGGSQRPREERSPGGGGSQRPREERSPGGGGSQRPREERSPGGGGSQRPREERSPGGGGSKRIREERSPAGRESRRPGETRSPGRRGSQRPTAARGRTSSGRGSQQPGLQQKAGLLQKMSEGPYCSPPQPYLVQQQKGHQRPGLHQQHGVPHTGPPGPGMQHGAPGLLKKHAGPYSIYSEPGLHQQQGGSYTGHPWPGMQQNGWPGRPQQPSEPGPGGPGQPQHLGEHYTWPGQQQHPRGAYTMGGSSYVSSSAAHNPPYIQQGPPGAAQVSTGIPHGAPYTTQMPTNGMLDVGPYTRGPPLNAGPLGPLPFGPQYEPQCPFVFPNSLKCADQTRRSRSPDGYYQRHNSCRSPRLAHSRSQSLYSLSRSPSSRSRSPYSARFKNRPLHARHSKSRSPSSSHPRRQLHNGARHSRTQSPYCSRASERRARRTRSQSSTSTHSRHQSSQRVVRLSSSPVRLTEHIQRAVGIKKSSMHSTRTGHLQKSDRLSSSTAKSTSERKHKLFGIKVTHFPPHVPDRDICVKIEHRFQCSGNWISVKIHGAQEDRYAVVLFKQQDEQAKALGANGEHFLDQRILVTVWEPPGLHVALCPLDKKARSHSRPLAKRRKSHQRSSYEKNKAHSHPSVTKDETHLRPLVKTEKLQPEESRILFVNNLDKNITEQDLCNTFGHFGKIVDVYINSLPRSSHQFAFLQFSSVVSVALAIETMNGLLLGKCRIKLSFGASQPSRCVFVDGLSSNLSNEYLAQRFSEHGTVEKVVYNHSRGAALIFYADETASQKAVEASRDLKITGDSIMMDYANDSFQLNFYQSMRGAAQATGDFMFG